MTDGPRPRPGGSQRGPQPDPVRRPAPGVADLRGRLLSGYGSPEGVVFAGAGVQYQDIDPAGAGAQYKKTTPSGNTGWVEIGAAGGGGGGGGALTWYPLTDIWTPAAGVSPHVVTGAMPYADSPRFALDDNFLYLAGKIDIAWGSAGPAPPYVISLGDIVHAPIVGSKPGPADSMNVWLFPAAVSQADVSTAILSMSMPWPTGPTGTFDFAVDSDTDSTLWSATITVSLDGTALAWQLWP